MAYKSITGAWRAISSLAQTGLGSPQTADTRLPFEGDLLDVHPDLDWVNDKEIGNILPTKHRIVSRKLDFKHKSKAFPTLCGLFISQTMGSDTVSTVGGGLAYAHAMAFNASAVELAKRTVVEFDGNSQTNYPDIACVAFTISGKRNDFVDFEADLVGSGAEATGDTTAEPADASESYHVFSDCSFTKGGTIVSGAQSGGSSINADVVDFKLAVKNMGKGVHLMGDTTGNYTSIRRGEMFGAELDLTVEIEDSSYHTDLFAGNENILHIPIVGGVAAGSAHYGIDILFPRLSYKAAVKGKEDGLLKVGLKCAVLLDPTNGGPTITVTNLHSKSYLATS